MGESRTHEYKIIVSKKRNNPKRPIVLKRIWLILLSNLFREPLLDTLRHIGSYIPQLAFTHVSVHNPQDSPYNLGRVQIRIELKLLVHSSCKFLFFKFLWLIPECPAVIIHSFACK